MLGRGEKEHPCPGAPSLAKNCTEIVSYLGPACHELSLDVRSFK